MKTLTTGEFKNFYEKDFKKKFFDKFILHYQNSNEGSFGVSVSTKLKFNSVQRNKYKRWTKEIMRSQETPLKINIIIIKELSSFLEFSKDLNKALKSVS